MPVANDLSEHPCVGEASTKTPKARVWSIPKVDEPVEMPASGILKELGSSHAVSTHLALGISSL